MEELATNANMTVIAIGGFLRRNEYSFYGHFSETILKTSLLIKLSWNARDRPKIWALDFRWK